MTCNHFSPSNKAFLVAISSSVDGPCNFSQDNQDLRWKEGVQNEIQALKASNTWTLERLPQTKHALTLGLQN